MRKGANTTQKPSDRRTAMVIVGLIVLVTVATVFVAHHIIESLEENSRKMRLYQVKAKYKPPEALDLIGDAVTVRPFGERHPKVEVLKKKANEAAARKDYQSAIDFDKLALEQFQRDIAVEHDRDANLSIGWRLHNISTYYTKLKKYDLAIEYANKALKVDEFGDYYLVRADAYEAKGNKVQAAKDRQKAKDVFAADKKARSDVSEMIMNVSKETDKD